ncbi:hypothetical protein ZWY2020_027108 [Hordeum vulgare]|nr:hypothetical protein ZWY2020_027108 [Hordeum vulgare]
MLTRGRIADGSVPVGLFNPGQEEEAVAGGLRAEGPAKPSHGMEPVVVDDDVIVVGAGDVSEAVEEGVGGLAGVVGEEEAAGGGGIIAFSQC